MDALPDASAKVRQVRQELRVLVGDHQRTRVEPGVFDGGVVTGDDRVSCRQGRGGSRVARVPVIPPGCDRTVSNVSVTSSPFVSRMR